MTDGDTLIEADNRGYPSLCIYLMPYFYSDITHYSHQIYGSNLQLKWFIGLRELFINYLRSIVH